MREEIEKIIGSREALIDIIQIKTGNPKAVIDAVDAYEEMINKLVALFESKDGKR